VTGIQNFPSWIAYIEGGRSLIGQYVALGRPAAAAPQPIANEITNDIRNILIFRILTEFVQYEKWRDIVRIAGIGKSQIITRVEVAAGRVAPAGLSIIDIDHTYTRIIVTMVLASFPAAAPPAANDADGMVNNLKEVFVPTLVATIITQFAPTILAQLVAVNEASLVSTYIYPILPLFFQFHSFSHSMYFPMNSLQ
jgi:hypothetical protein